MTPNKGVKSTTPSGYRLITEAFEESEIDYKLPTIIPVSTVVAFIKAFIHWQHRSGFTATILCLTGNTCWNIQLSLVILILFSRASVFSFQRARAVMGASPHWQFISVDLASKSDFHIEPSSSVIISIRLPFAWISRCCFIQHTWVAVFMGFTLGELQTSCSSPRAAGHLPGLRLVRLGLSGDSRPFTRGAVSTPGAPCCGMVAHGLRVGAGRIQGGRGGFKN